MSTFSGAEAAQLKGFAPGGLDVGDAEAMADELGARFSTAREAISSFIFANTGARGFSPT